MDDDLYALMVYELGIAHDDARSFIASNGKRAPSALAATTRGSEFENTEPETVAMALLEIRKHRAKLALMQHLYTHSGSTPL